MRFVGMEWLPSTTLIEELAPLMRSPAWRPADTPLTYGVRNEFYYCRYIFVDSPHAHLHSVYEEVHGKLIEELAPKKTLKEVCCHVFNI